MAKIFLEAQHQRCLVDKTANVLPSLPKVMKLKVKTELLYEMVWLANKSAAVNNAIYCFVGKLFREFLEAIKKLKKDREELLVFY
ncbi:MAG: transposase [Arsenophonus sp.]